MREHLKTIVSKRKGGALLTELMVSAPLDKGGDGEQVRAALKIEVLKERECLSEGDFGLTLIYREARVIKLPA